MGINQASEATLDHFRNGLKIAKKRVEEAYRLTAAYLTRISATEPGAVIVEIGATSVATSQKLAGLAQQHDARLFIIADDENARGVLSTAFTHNPHVTVVDVDDELPRRIDLAVSASGYLCTRLQDNESMRAALKYIAASGAELLVVEHQYGVLADFLSVCSQAGLIMPRCLISRLVNTQPW